MQPVRFEKYLNAFKKEKEMLAEEMDTGNYNLGKYLMLAYHKPKSYPSKPFLQKVKLRPMTPQEMEEVMKKNTVILGGTINGTEDS